MACPNFSDVLGDLRNIKTSDYLTSDYARIDMPRYDFSNNFVEHKYKFPYELIQCNSECRKKIEYKQRTGDRPNPFIKKNEDILKNSIDNTNKSYTFLYLWFIVMVVIIYVLIIAIVSENSYHPLMNFIIFIFIVYLSYYIFTNLSFRS